MRAVSRYIPPIKRLTSIVIALCLICCDPITAEAYVNDNVSNASLEQTVGDAEGKAFSTIFDFLQNIWEQLLDMSDNIGTAQDSTGLYARLDSIEASVNKISTLVKNQSATAGGGCYYTVYSMKPYLEGYKLKLSDGTSSKSCVIMYDEDSDYYSGVLKAPLANNITVEILDMESGISQGKMSTSADTTSGYATINLDTLISNNFATLARIDDSLAVNFYQDSTYTQDVNKATTLISIMNVADGHVSDFFDSALGLSLESKSYSQLLNNQTEFVSVLGSDYKTYMIQDSGFGQSVANSRNCLRTIYDSDTLVSLCENNSTFCGYLQNTTIPVIEVTRTAGTAYYAIGKFVCLQLNTGCRGNCATVDQSMGYNRGRHRYADRKGVVTRGVTSCLFRGNVIINAPATSQYDVNVFDCDDLIGSTPQGNVVYRCIAPAHLGLNSVFRNKFLDTVNTSAYSDIHIEFGTKVGINGGEYRFWDMTTGAHAANFYFKYIDLDAED